MFSEQQLSDIRERLPIAELVSEYVQIKKAGRSHRGLCPFHQEKSSSFFVSPEKEIFHCFGCGVGGNIFHFLMKIENLSFPEAVQRLAQRCGVVVTGSPNSGGASAPQEGKKLRALEIQRWAAWYYHCLLKKAPPEDPAWLYLKQRQIPPETALSFHLGYCSPQGSGLKTYLAQKGCSVQEIEQSGLYRGPREFFRGRLIFPIFRRDGKVVGLGGRLIDPKDQGPKYLNSAESDIFKKSDLFYGLHLAKDALREQKRAIIVEGYLDVIALHAHGFTEAIAPLGTSLTQSHARLLKRLAEEIILCFDGDTAGQQAAHRALEHLLVQSCFPKWVELESGEDPDSYLRHYGKLQFEKKLKIRRNLLDELIDKSVSKLIQENPSPEAKGQVATEVMTLLSKIPDPVVRKLYRRRLAGALEVPEAWIQEVKERERKSSPALTPVKKARWFPEEAALIEIWLKFPELRTELLSAMRQEDFFSQDGKRIAQILWQLDTEGLSAQTALFFDRAPEDLVEILSQLTLQEGETEELSVAQLSLKQALYRLQEKRLKAELKSLQNEASGAETQILQEKIQTLSQILKNKERTYDEKTR